MIKWNFTQVSDQLFVCFKYPDCHEDKKGEEKHERA
jgi:hypothetical protein